MRRLKTIAVGITAGVLILGLSVYAIFLHADNTKKDNQLAAFYNKAFEELLTDVDSLKTKLNKLEAASGMNQYTMLLMDVWRQTGDTESSIAALPVSYAGTSTLTQFMNRTGDYCRYLSRKLAQGEDITSDDMDQIRSLSDACTEVYTALDEMYQQGYPGSFDIDEMIFMSDETTEGNLDFTNQEFPRLQYDGPFSESTEDKQPEGLSGGEVTQGQAHEAAADFLGVSTDVLGYDSDLNGTIPAYGFSGETDGVPLTIYITKQGGQVLWYMSQRETGISAVPTDDRYAQLTKIAQNFARDKGYGDTKPSYAQFYGGMAVINLAPVEDDIVLYPDLIKVWVDISQNDVAGIDANNYLMSHKQRDMPSAELTQMQAQQKVNDNLQIDSVRLALIPLESGDEVLCWEFTGSIDENEYIVYINAQTGVEEDILMIQHTNEGTLVM